MHPDTSLRKKASAVRCINCSDAITLHVSLTEQYPEWSALTNNSGVKVKKTSVDMSGSTTSGESSESGGGGGNLGDTLFAAANLFDLLAQSRSPLEVAMCSECAEWLTENLDSQLRKLEEEAGEYRRAAEALAAQAATGPDPSSLKIELAKLASEEAVVAAELARLQDEEADIDAQLSAEKALLAEAQVEEERLLAKARDQQRKVLDYEQEEASASNQHRYADSQLEKLSKTNIFNLTFHIWHSGHLGTINGFRLGRLPEEAVEWAEINAAWGQTVLLLTCLARKLRVVFQRYELVPYGNFSFIRTRPEPGAKPRELPLYWSGGHKFVGNNKIDSGILGFLDCLGQLKKELESHAAFTLPYQILKDKIIDKNSEYSVKIQFNSEERWTKAMKLMLMNLKWALAWIASIHSPPS